MERYERQLLEGLGAFLRRESARPLLKDTADWEKLWRLADQQKVLAMAADALVPVLGRGDMASAVLRRAAEDMAGQIRRDGAFAAAWQTLAEAGCRPLVVKGAVCRALYPKPDLRISADEDLLLAPSEVPAAAEALARAGWTVSGGGQVTSCRDGRTGAYLELHSALFPPDSEAYGQMNGLFDGAFDRAVETMAAGAACRTLCPADHLRYLILHACKHFLHSGVGIRQACDVSLAARAWGGGLDWGALTASLAAARAERFAAGLMEVGRRHLGVDYPAPVTAWLEELRVDCGPLLCDLLAAGIYGSSSAQRLHSSRITLAAVSDGSGAHTARQVWRTVFPPPDALAGRYPYLARRPWLVPVAWVQRLASYRSRSGPADARESLAIGRERVGLLRRYGIID